MVLPNRIGAIVPARPDFAGQHLAVEQRDHRLQRPNPEPRAVAPLHRLRPGQRLHRRIDDAGQHLGRRPALLLQHREPELALAGVALLGLVERGEARALQEALDRLVRRADARAAPLLADIGTRGGQAVDHQCQPPRRREGARVGEAQAGGLQAIATRRLRSSAARACMRAGISSDRSSRRNSAMVTRLRWERATPVALMPFGTKKEKSGTGVPRSQQKRPGHHAALATCVASQASQQALARSRTRRI